MYCPGINEGTDPTVPLINWTFTPFGPGPMEISIEYNNQRTDRRFRFNVADAGKAITGTYVYMKCPT